MSEMARAGENPKAAGQPRVELQREVSVEPPSSPGMVSDTDAESNSSGEGDDDGGGGDGDEAESDLPDNEITLGRFDRARRPWLLVFLSFFVVAVLFILHPFFTVSVPIFEFPSFLFSLYSHGLFLIRCTYHATFPLLAMEHARRAPYQL